MKATSRTTRLTREQLDALVVMAALAADATTRQAAADPAGQDRLRRDAATFRGLADLLREAVAAEVVVWVPDD